MNNYYSYRTVQVIKIFEEVFGDEKERIVGLMAGQSVNPWHLSMRLKYNWSPTALTHAEAGIDAIAIAPYFGLPNYKENLATYEAWSDTMHQGGLDKLFEEIRYGTHILAPQGKLSDLDQVYKDMQDNKDIADQEGLALVAYEGGQHLSAHGGLERNDKLQDLLIAANRDPRMGEIYHDYFRKWFDIGGGVFANFMFIGKPSIWGSWGVLETQYQDPNTATKYVALSNYASELSTIYERENDTIAPTSVSNLVTTDITETSLVLNWGASTDNIGVSKYKVFQGEELIAETVNLSYAITELTPGTEYSYSVVAFDFTNNQSAPTTITAATVAPVIEEAEEIVEEDVDAILVETCADLEAIAEDLTANYKLDSDIDCDGYDNFKSIGNWRHGFSGTLDGQGYTINNLYLTDKWSLGLFRKITSGTVKNLNLVGFVVDTNQYTSGLLAGTAENALIENVHVQGDLLVDLDKPKGIHGAIVGNMKAVEGTCSLVNSSADVKLDGKLVMTGGLVGKANGVGTVNIRDSFFEGDINALKGSNRMSSILGIAFGKDLVVNIDHCLATGTLKIEGNRFGTMIGQVNKAKVLINNSYSNVELTAEKLRGDHEFYGMDMFDTVTVSNSHIHYLSRTRHKSRKLDGATIIDFNTITDDLNTSFYSNSLDI